MRGRPVDNDKAEQQKQALLDAAYQLLAVKSYKNITIRELATQAEVTSAMISYYFGNKENLFIALINQFAHNNFSQIEKIANSDDPIKMLIRHMVSFFTNNKAIARFIHDEVLIESSSLRDRFIDLIPKRMAAMLPTIIKRLQQTGQFDPMVNPKYAAFSLISLVMMPFIIEPVRERAWQITEQEINSDEWLEHTYQLFIMGCARGNKK